MIFLYFCKTSIFETHWLGLEFFLVLQITIFQTHRTFPKFLLNDVLWDTLIILIFQTHRPGLDYFSKFQHKFGEFSMHCMWYIYIHIWIKYELILVKFTQIWTPFTTTTNYLAKGSVKIWSQHSSNRQKAAYCSFNIGNSDM